MDNSGSVFDSAVVVHANHFEFQRRSRPITNPETFSYMLMWSVSGRGRVHCCGTYHEVAAGSAVMLPWRHIARHEADRDDPWIGGSVHILPWHDPKVPIERWVGLGANDPLSRSPARRGTLWAGFERVVRCSPQAVERVVHLGEAVISSLEDGQATDAMLRSYGMLIAHTFAASLNDPPTSSTLPPALAAMQEQIGIFYRQPLTTAQIAETAGCSVTTAERLFRQYTGQTPQQWLRGVRMTHAARLLRNTNLHVAEIARRVGYGDPHYFSRVFRAVHGMSPREYSRRTSLF